MTGKNIIREHMGTRTLAHTNAYLHTLTHTHIHRDTYKGTCDNQEIFKFSEEYHE